MHPWTQPLGLTQSARLLAEIQPRYSPRSPRCTRPKAPACSRQCIVQDDVQFLRKEVARLHLSLPSGCCPNLVAFALALPVA